MNDDLQSLGFSLAASLARNSASVVWDRVKALRAGQGDQETIEGLNQIITELITEKNDLARIAQAYQSELVSQRLTAGDIQYMTEQVLPVLETLAESTGNSVQAEKMMDLLEPLLSIEMVNVMQLLGFNFRAAIGEPLTDLVAKMIAARAPVGPEGKEPASERLRMEHELAIFKLAQSAAATQRFNQIMGRN